MNFSYCLKLKGEDDFRVISIWVRNDSKLVNDYPYITTGNLNKVHGMLYFVVLKL